MDGSPRINPYYEKLMKLFKSNVEVPSLPATSFKLAKMLEDPNVTLRELQKIIELDPGLSGRLLKMARSAIYSRGVQITNIEQAMGRIGLKNVRRAALTVEIIENLKIGFQRYINWNGFWYHSILVAQLCEKFERAYFPEDEPQVGYLAGLLHDVGKLFMAKHFSEQMTFIHSLSGDFRQVPEGEMEMLGFNHPLASSMLCDTWGIPDIVSKAIQFHHNPEKREKCDDFVFACILCACDALANLTGVNVTPVEFSWEEFEDFPAWIVLKEIGAKAPLEFELDDEANIALDVVNQIAGETVITEE